MSDGIAALDIAVAGRDTLWVVDMMNRLVVRGEGAYVREFATVLDAVDDLTPDHPAVLLVGPLTSEDSTADFPDLIRDHPAVAFVFTTDDPDGAQAAELAAITGEAPLDAADLDLVVTTAMAALAGRRRTVGALVVGDLLDAEEGTTVSLITGPGSLLRVVAVTSGKGGVGTTTIAINLAAALVEAGSRVTLVDAHGATGDVGFLLGLAKPERITLDVVELDNDSIPHYTSVHPATDVRVVILPADESQLDTLTPRQLLEVLVALSAHTDVVVVDVPLDLLTAADILPFTNKVLIVTTSQLASLKNTRIAADVIGRHHRLGVVRNDTSTTWIDHGRAALEDLLQVELTGELPYDESIATGAVADPVSALAKPRSVYTKTMRELAAILVRDDFARHDDDDEHLAPRDGGARGRA